MNVICNCKSYEFKYQSMDNIFIILKNLTCLQLYWENSRFDWSLPYSLIPAWISAAHRMLELSVLLQRQNVMNVEIVWTVQRRPKILFKYNARYGIYGKDVTPPPKIHFFKSLCKLEEKTKYFFVITYIFPILTLILSTDCSVSIVTRPQAGQLRNWSLIPGRGNKISLLHMSSPTVGPTQPPIQ